MKSTQPTLPFDLLTHIGTFLNPNEKWSPGRPTCPYREFSPLYINERMYLAGVLRDKDLLQFYLQRDGIQHACTSIAFAGNLTLLRWLQRAGCQWNEKTCVVAAYAGYLEMLQWLLAAEDYEYAWDLVIFEAAAYGGHLAVLKWLHSEGCGGDDWACNAAAINGHLEVLKWTRSDDFYGSRFNDWICNAAAFGGHLDVLKWLRGDGCPWNEETCEAAAEGGHLEVLKWLRSEGCPWDHTTCRAAAENGHLEMLKWLGSEDCPGSDWDWDDMPGFPSP